VRICCARRDPSGSQRCMVENGVSELNPKLSIGLYKSCAPQKVVHDLSSRLKDWISSWAPSCAAEKQLRAVHKASCSGRTEGHFQSRFVRVRASAMSRLVRTPGLESLVSFVPLEVVL
jgi:hypothetical protein